MEPKFSDKELEIIALRAQLEEANDVIEAIRSGAVDAIVVNDKTGPRLYTLKSSDQTYRVFIEKMNEGAVTLDREGIVVYCNSRFAEMVGVPLSKVTGMRFEEFVPKKDRIIFNKLIKDAWKKDAKGELDIEKKGGLLTPVLMSLTTLELEDGESLSIILADLTAQKKTQTELKIKNEELQHANAFSEQLNDELESKVRQRTNELQESTEHFAFATDAADLGTWNLNPVTYKFIGNNRLKSWFGLAPSNEIDLSAALEMIDEKDRPHVIDAIGRALQFDSGGDYDIDYTINSPETGQKRIVRAKGKAFFDENGVAYRFSGTLQDITEDVRAAEQQVIAARKMEELEERVRLAVESAEMGTFDLNFEKDQVIASPRFDSIFGLSGHVDHKTFVNAIHPDDQKIRELAHREALVTGKLFYDARVALPNRSLRWIRAQGRVIYDVQGKPERMLGTVMDITDEKNAEEEIRDTNQRLEIALEAGRLGSYEIEIDTGEMVCTSQFRSNYGIAENVPLTYGQLLEAILPAYREKVRQGVADAIQNCTIYTSEYEVQFPDESLHWVKASGKCRYDESGKPTRFVGVTFDITDHKDLQKQKDDFIGIASHELKTPVTIIKAYTQLLEKLLKQKGEEKEASIVNKMDAQINRLTNLIGDLLDVTKINSGKLQFNEKTFEFNRCVKNVVDELQRTTDKHRFVEKIPPFAVKVFADEERIGQVITNLITNAIKYSPNADQIVIETNVKDGEVIFCVQDFGIGIPKEKQGRVFEQFYRVSGDMQHTFPGLGLGLFIASDIISRAGGRIWVESLVQEGSTFCFSLPVLSVSTI